MTTTCPTCQQYEAEIRYMAQNDYRRARELYKAYVEHQTRDHCLHIATPKEPVKQSRTF